MHRSVLACLTLAAIMVLALASCAFSRVVYVKWDSPGPTFDGASWDTAFHTVQQGLNSAAAWDEVRVARGVYVECITLKAGVRLYGGYAGVGDTRGIRAYATVLDGNRSGSVVTCPSGATTATRIDGFTIRNGSTPTYGGGIYCSGSAPVIANNTITQNTADHGGGISCPTSAPVIVNNIISGNSAYAGGGVDCSHQAVVTNNTVTGNVAAAGGGIYCGGGSAGKMSNNIVAFNSSGIYGSASAGLVLQNNCIYGNQRYNYDGIAPGASDISVDPLLADVEHGNPHIQPTSPCRNAGLNSAPWVQSLDIDGQPRMLDGTVDIGADESDGTSWSVEPRIVRVSTTGDDANDGSTWALAKRTVQAAIDAAFVLGGEVWVKAGTYDERIELHPYVHLYGGFDGTESSRSERDWRANRTTLDGGAGGSVVTARAGHQVSTIDGFTIRNGQGTNGAGIRCLYAAPTIANNTIVDNRADRGGGIACEYCSPVITGNLIAGNSARYAGGGVYCVSDSSAAVISGNFIVGNGAGNGGGGIYCSSSRAVITGNTIAANNAHDGGALHCYAYAPTVSNNILAFNTSGVFCSGTTRPVLRNNCVHGNTAYNYSGLTAGAGDISVDPLLSDRAYGDYHISPTSPCRDAGWGSAPGLTPLDIDGQPRVQDGTVDIGADESDGTVRPVGPYAVIRVGTDGSDTNDGSSWASAKKTVQAAIDSASLVGGEVWVKAGVYIERIKLSPHVYLYGGFAGTETSRSERNWRTNRSILDGDGGGSVVSVLAGHQVSAIDGFTIRNGTGTLLPDSVCGGGICCSDSSPTIANNTITNNRATDLGGGIYSGYSSMPIIANNTITLNNSRSGGGICYTYSPTTTNNTIVANSGNTGGGVYCGGSSPSMVANNIIAFNSSGIQQYGTPTLRNNCVYGNTAGNYSAAPGVGDISTDPLLAGIGYGNFHIQAASPCRNTGWNGAPGLPAFDIDVQPRVQGGTVDIGADESGGEHWSAGPSIIVRVSPGGNDAADGSSWASAKKTVQAAIDVASALGGEVWIKAGTYNERITLAQYVFVYGGFAGTEISRAGRNWALNKTILDGGASGSVVTAVAIASRLSAIEGCTIRNGAASEGAGICCDYASPTIAHNTITRNTAASGAGIHCSDYSSPVITTNIITGNAATGSGGGVLCTQNSSPLITNNTVVGNSAINNGGGIYTSSSSPKVSNNIIAFNSSGICRSLGAPVLRNNCVFGNSGYNYMSISAGTGDISVDPLFLDRSNEDYHLTPLSPCINAGWNDADGIRYDDIDGDFRVQESIIDIGVDEFYLAPATVARTKALPNSSLAAVSGAVVSGTFANFFYVEADDRSSGIRVDKASHGFTAGMKVDVSGVIKTSTWGERYIEAMTASPTGSAGSVEPLILPNCLVTGADWHYDPSTGAGQVGIRGSIHMNNVGMLITTTGRVTYSPTGAYFVINDGSKTTDASGYRGIRVTIPTGVTKPAVGKYVKVTGISSIFKSGTEYYPLLRIRNQADIVEAQ